jgi:UDP-N-acetylglucosamine acyltransferase
VSICKTAVIHPKSSLANGVKIGSYSIIGKDVIIEEGTVIDHHVHIQGPTVIGKNNHIFSFASIGIDPQDKKYHDEKTSLLIGSGNTIREYVTISRGTTQDQSMTQIGDNNLFMAYVHVAHDCMIGSHNTFANNATLAGHVLVGNYVGFGGMTAFHQYTKIGSYAFCAGGSIVTRDIPPFTLSSGYPAKICGLNLEGIRRQDFSEELKSELKGLYKKLFRSTDLILETAHEILGGEYSEHGKYLARFVLESERGIAR